MYHLGLRINFIIDESYSRNISFSPVKSRQKAIKTSSKDKQEGSVKIPKIRIICDRENKDDIIKLPPVYHLYNTSSEEALSGSVEDSPMTRKSNQKSQNSILKSSIKQKLFKNKLHFRSRSLSKFQKPQSKVSVSCYE